MQAGTALQRVVIRPLMMVERVVNDFLSPQNRINPGDDHDWFGPNAE